MEPCAEGDAGAVSKPAKQRSMTTSSMNSSMGIRLWRKRDDNLPREIRKRGRKSKGLQMTRSQTKALFEEAMKAPAIGGCIDLQEAHSEYLLPPEVLLFEPDVTDIYAGGKVNKNDRQIFLNTKLEEEEVEKLELLRQALAESGGDTSFPEYVSLHALRLLQYKKFDIKRTLDLILLHMEERVKRLPIPESDVLQDLRQGFMYWHGRDRRCRPCLVIRMGEMGDMRKDKERAVRTVLFVLEYGIRWAMVPGRVENWVVILDLNNASKIVSMFELRSLAATAGAIASTLESVYCGRMGFMKIVNMPGMLRPIVEAAIPADTKAKVSVAKSMDELRGPFEPHQLERRYGGTAEDKGGAATYPYHFFPNATGKGASEEKSVHSAVERIFHEGKLWDTSAPDKIKQLELDMQAESLCPDAAAALSVILAGKAVKPCRDMELWQQLQAVRARRMGPIEEDDGESGIDDQASETGPQKDIDKNSPFSETETSLITV